MEGFKRVNILGCPFDAISFEETENLIRKAVKENLCIQLVPGSIDFVMKAKKDPIFRQELWRADIVFADGVPIVWAASLLGEPLKGRVSGTDIVWSCAQISSENECPVALIGGKFEITQAAMRNMKEKFPSAKLHALFTPFPLGPKENEDLVKEIRRVKAKIVLAALGAPRQERWVQGHLSACAANVGIGIGSAFDIISGDKKRAPKFMRDHGFEWLHRMLLEPRRLGKRYLIEDSPFLWHLAIAIFKKRIFERKDLL